MSVYIEGTAITLHLFDNCSLYSKMKAHVCGYMDVW